jgi:class 3 adenylate cyclase
MCPSDERTKPGPIAVATEAAGPAPEQVATETPAARLEALEAEHQQLQKENKNLVRKLRLAERKLEQLDKIAQTNESVNIKLYDELEGLSQQLRQEKERVNQLLLNILPLEIKRELEETGQVEPKKYDDATVMFTDFQGFTTFSERGTAIDVVNHLRLFFDAFDDVVDRYQLEKLKTIGDAYMCAGGVPIANTTHAVDCIRGGLDMVAEVERINEEVLKPRSNVVFNIRVGIHSGPLVGGVVGKKKFVFDIWGDTVNTANRIESNGALNAVTISEVTYEKVRGKVVAEFIRFATLKGKNAPMGLYRVVGLK